MKIFYMLKQLKIDKILIFGMYMVHYSKQILTAFVRKKIIPIILVKGYVMKMCEKYMHLIHFALGISQFFLE